MLQHESTTNSFTPLLPRNMDTEFACKSGSFTLHVYQRVTFAYTTAQNKCEYGRKAVVLLCIAAQNIHEYVRKMQ